MRTIYLATTALLLGTGLAMAQTTPSPAPSGAINAPSVSPGTASPGNMGPNEATQQSATTPGAMSSNAPPASGATTPSPAPDGAVNAPSVTAQGTSPGKMAPSQPGAPVQPGDMADSSAPAHPWHHKWSHGGAMTLPEDASATTYLHIANGAIKHHNVTLADDALSHAETRLLTRSVPQGQISADDSPSVQSIESARQALQSGDFMKASADTHAAASSATGM